MAQHWMLRAPIPVVVLFAIVFGGLYFVARHEWVPLKVIRPAKTQRVEVTPAKPFELQWPARTEPPKAPPLSLLVPATAFGQWTSDDQFVLERRPAGGQERFYFTAWFPDSDGLSTRALGKSCYPDVEATGCYAQELRITLMQEAPRADEPGYIVMDSKARGVSDAATSGPIQRLKAFWVKEARDTDRIEFAGWDCPGEEPPFLERNRCFAPATIEERRWPTKAGYQRLVRLMLCSAGQRDCKLYFPFRGRHVEVTPFDGKVGRIEEETNQLFLASWEYLNGLRADTRRDPSPAQRLARAERSLENCRTATGWVEYKGNPRPRDEVGRYRRAQCALAAYYAASLLETNPVEASGLLTGAIATSPFPPARTKAYLDAVIAALDKAGKRESPEMIEAQLTVAMQSVGQPGSAGDIARLAAIKEALRVGNAVRTPASDTLIAMYRQLGYVMSSEREPDEKIAVIERWLAAVRQAHGPSDQALREPLSHLCFALSHGQRKEHLKECADEYLPLWLAAAAAESGERFSNETSTGGFSLLDWYASYGLTLNKPREVLPAMKKVAAILQPRVEASAWSEYGARLLKYVEQKAANPPR